MWLFRLLLQCQLGASVAEAQLHGELVFAVFKLDHIAVFLDDSPMLAPECQVRCANSKGS